MEEPCMYSKYGFCKFREKCRRMHYNEVCTIWRHENQQKHAKNDTPKFAKDIIEKKVADSEVNVATTTVNSMMTVKPVKARLKLILLKRYPQRLPIRSSIMKIKLII